MTAAEADQRIILSRQTLAKFVQMAAAGRRLTVENVPLVEEEISILDRIAKDHPGKIEKLLALVGDWVKFRDSIKVTVH